MLDPDRSVPLLRYQTGDVARLLDRDHVAATLRRHGVHDWRCSRGAPRVAGPRQRGAAERLTGGLLQRRAVRQSRARAPPHRGRSPDLFRQPLHDARSAGPRTGAGELPWSRASCERWRPMFDRRVWCCGRTPTFPSAWVWTTSASSLTTCQGSRIRIRILNSPWMRWHAYPSHQHRAGAECTAHASASRLLSAPVSSCCLMMPHRGLRAGRDGAGLEGGVHLQLREVHRVARRRCRPRSRSSCVCSATPPSAMRSSGLVKGRELAGHAIVVSRVVAAGPKRACHVLYVSGVVGELRRRQLHRRTA